MREAGYAMRLALVRHGQTDWNVHRRCQGWEDVPLNDVGRLQGQKVAERLSSWRIDEILTSDLERAQDTASMIAGKVGLRPLPRKGLREVNFGQCQGLRFADVQGSPLGKTWDAFKRGDHYGALPNGEHPDEVVARFNEVLDEALRRARDHSGKRNVVMVGHGGSFRLAICAILGIHLRHWRQFGQGNAAVTIFEFKDGARTQLVSLNDTCHLQAVRTDESEADSLLTAG